MSGSGEACAVPCRCYARLHPRAVNCRKKKVSATTLLHAHCSIRPSERLGHHLFFRLCTDVLIAASTQHHIDKSCIVCAVRSHKPAQAQEEDQGATPCAIAFVYPEHACLDMRNPYDLSRLSAAVN